MNITTSDLFIHFYFRYRKKNQLQNHHKPIYIETISKRQGHVRSVGAKLLHSFGTWFAQLSFRFDCVYQSVFVFFLHFFQFGKTFFARIHLYSLNYLCHVTFRGNFVSHLITVPNQFQLQPVVCFLTDARQYTHTHTPPQMKFWSSFLVSFSFFFKLWLLLLSLVLMLFWWQ